MTKIYSFSDLRFISRKTLKNWIQNGLSPSGKFLVIDVRDSDYIGGHIKNSINLPSNTFYDFLPNLYKKLYDDNIKVVVFHCMLSQSRGPSATLKFLRGIEEINQLEIKEHANNIDVFVLKGGFSKWQQDYGLDKSLTDNYNEEIWKFGME
ncbi:unnamed protein product [Candida verbasci]|uniref:Rhodanese domain-containing protein n=1 Tax=Candida verbasci TaxID=1227364 RepID=A0A9W4TYL5_9ASCO|nr:unnamed protein product [Candida verbasci]